MSEKKQLNNEDWKILGELVLNEIRQSVDFLSEHKRCIDQPTLHLVGSKRSQNRVVKTSVKASLISKEYKRLSKHMDLLSKISENSNDSLGIDDSIEEKIDWDHKDDY